MALTYNIGNMICKNCGKQVDVENNFCLNCGLDLTDSKPKSKLYDLKIKDKAKINNMPYSYTGSSFATYDNINTSTSEQSAENKNKGKYYALIAAFVFVVILLLAKGNVKLEKTTVSFPNIIGLEEQEAVEILRGSNLVNYNIEYIESPEPVGIVIDTNFTINQEVEKDDVVTLFVSMEKEFSYNDYYGDGNYNPLFQINILKTGNNVKIRQTPTTTLENKIGNIHTDEVYNVYETVENDGYTWYRLDNGWIANDVGWSEIDSKCTGGDYSNRQIVISDNDVGVYDNPVEDGNSRVKIKNIYSGETHNVYYVKNTGSHIWYKIGPNMWIKESHSGERVSFR